MIWTRWVKQDVAVSECVHYAGFRYGHGEYHPYETYVRRFHSGDKLEDIRSQFLEFLRGYRPTRLDHALGIELTRAHPLWLFPWHPLWKFLLARRGAGWYRSPDKVPDIITSFSIGGIPRFLVESEFKWLEQAYNSIAHHGYRPERYGYPVGRILLGPAGRRACLLLDGNHRVSAISTLGYTALSVRISPAHTVHFDKIDSWPGVRAGFFTRDEAREVFMAYFSGNQSFHIGDANVAFVD